MELSMSSADQAPAHSNGKESRDEILRAAAGLFMEFGYAATSVDAVAERLGATKGRIYHHYRSKADLFFDVQVTAMKRLNEEIEPLARGSGNAVERIAAMALRHTQILLTDMPMQKVAVQGLERHLLGASASTKRLRAVVEMRDDYEKMFREVIDEGVREGLFVDLPARLAVKPFLGALNWATVWFSPRRLQGAEAVDEIAHTLAAFALRGILKAPHHESVRQTALLGNDLG
jgi:AcrR family transcriptional regulator